MSDEEDDLDVSRIPMEHRGPDSFFSPVSRMGRKEEQRGINPIIPKAIIGVFRGYFAFFVVLLRIFGGKFYPFIEAFFNFFL